MYVSFKIRTIISASCVGLALRRGRERERLRSDPAYLFLFFTTRRVRASSNLASFYLLALGPAFLNANFGPPIPYVELSSFSSSSFVRRRRVRVASFERNVFFDRSTRKRERETLTGATDSFFFLVFRGRKR